MKPKDANQFLGFLDEIRSIAQYGINYTKDPYDSKRYERLLELVSDEYSGVSDLPEDLILERFRKELGYLTPKVGVNGIVISDQKVLLEKRSDDGLWGLPGGWADMGETPDESLRREFFEETGLSIKGKGLLCIFTRHPGDYGQPHGSYHLLYDCEVLSGDLRLSEESLELKYCDPHGIKDWHKDHYNMVKKAIELKSIVK